MSEPTEPLAYGPRAPGIHVRKWFRVEIVVPIALIIAFGVLYMVVSDRASERANVIHCANTLRKLWSSMLLYANENRGTAPPSMGSLARTQDISAVIFICPGSSDRAAPDGPLELRAATIDSYDGHCSYRYVGTGRQMDALPPTFVLAYELPGNHAGQTCILYGDGHVERHPDATARKIIAEVEAGKNPPSLK